MRVWVMIIFLPILAIGQGSHTTLPLRSENLAYQLRQYSQTEGVIKNADVVIAFAGKLEQKKKAYKNERHFLNYLFAKTHQKFLKHYTEYASFNELLKNGSYNCLTATALYALMLEYLEIDFDVIETNYHIFLIAHCAGGKVLFEATDPARGFVDNAQEIESRIRNYRENRIEQNSARKTLYRFGFDLYNTVSLSGLSGLMHYNLAIKAYNEQEFSLAIYHLDKALPLYQSPRIEEFSRIVLLAVVESNLEQPVKDNYVRKIQHLRKKRFAGIANVSITNSREF